MNEFFVLSLIVFTFALGAFCMNPSNWKPPSPDDVLFGECLFVPRITGDGALPDEIHYSYRHICRQVFPQFGPQPADHERNWYFVGSLKSVVSQSQNLSTYNYAPIRQMDIQFVFLKGLTVKFVSRVTQTVFTVTFQSVQQRQAFYGLVYHNVVLTEAAPNKIGVLHEIPIREDGKIGQYRKIGNNVEAVCEANVEYWCITLRNEEREPILIFSQAEASITCMRSRLFNRLQLLMRAHETFYILTFPSYVEAGQFSDSLMKFVKILHMKHIDAEIIHRLKFNSITMDS